MAEETVVTGGTEQRRTLDHQNSVPPFLLLIRHLRHLLSTRSDEMGARFDRGSGAPLDQEVDEEITFHIEMRTRELVERGVEPKTAREIVLARLGDVRRLKRTCVDLGRRRERERCV